MDTIHNWAEMLRNLDRIPQTDEVSGRGLHSIRRQPWNRSDIKPTAVDVWPSWLKDPPYWTTQKSG
eukprot:291894-Amphidinium_carterae.1